MANRTPKLRARTAGFAWTARREQAAALVAEGELALAEIARKVGAGLSTLKYWKAAPAFAARVEEHLAVHRAAARTRGIARLEQRVQALNERWERLRQIIEARAKSAEMARVPGGSTGLLVKRTRSIGSGENFQVIEEYVVDVALLKELREHEKQAAQELGQWVETHRVEQVAKAYVVLGPDDI